MPSRAYLCCLLISGFFFSAVFLPGSVPDEEHHFYRAYSYSNILQGVEGNDHATNMRMADYEFQREMGSLWNADRGLNRVRYDDVLAEAYPVTSTDNARFFFPVYGSSTVSVTNMHSLPQLRLIPALGITFAQILNLNGLWTYYMGRLFNFACFAALAYFAVKITPVGKLAFMILSLLPMTLHMASSYSSDAVIIGLAFLFASLCFKCIYSKTAIESKTLIGICVVMLLLAPCKVIYGLLSLLVLAIPAGKFKNRHISMLFKIGVPIIAAASVAIFSIASILTIVNPSSNTVGSASLSAGTVEYYSLTDFIHAPLHTLLVYANTLFVYGDFYLSTFVGGSLSWFQTELIAPWSLVFAYLLLLFVSSQGTRIDNVTISLKQKIGFALIAVLVFFAVLTSMFSGHTAETSDVINGVQGRYFIPIAPLVALIFRFRGFLLPNKADAYAMLATVGLNMMYLVMIFAAACRIV